MINGTACQRSALAWIIGKMEKHDLPYQIVGGLAVIAYGGTRPPNDIDFFVPLGPDAAAFLQDIDPYIVWGPEAVVAGSWDITYLKLNYEGQKIEIGASAQPKIEDAATGDWVTKRIDLDTSVLKEVFGCKVRVMPVAQLIAYKRVLGREVDLTDIRDLTRSEDARSPR